MEASSKGNYAGLIFLLIVLLLYGVIALLDPEKAQAAWHVALALFLKVLPIFALVFVVIFVINLFIRPEWVRKHLGSDSGLRGWGVAIAGGILSVGPVYVWYALLKELREKGMRTALMSAFLYNRGVKLPLLPLLIHYFGMAFTITLAGYMMFFSIVTALLLEWLMTPSQKADSE
jgi:uncharacterized membrane protein YraQ (UPF0718 family)